MGVVVEMGCTNLLDNEALVTSMAGFKADARLLVVPAVLTALDGIDWGKAAVQVARETGSADGLASLRPDYGGLAEDMIASALSERGYLPVALHESANEKGIDGVFFNPDTNEILVAEVKSTVVADKHRPVLSSTKSGKQAGKGWTNARLPSAGLEHAQWDDVTSRVFHVNLQTGQASEWSVTGEGKMQPLDKPFDIADL